ncbi:AfsR/SARP family transcriptional regulator [Amycolatopsis balhimycina]|uniref:AfsR/SARP family transcriptional regulator n=1 Tax=Amycolatopsis balhimycina TaxID=208443 RepID=UPI00037483D0|nr:tetratricopeptide repeat protein [Amycolatopsis balhimycina]
MEIRLLGVVEVWDRGRRLPDLGTPQQRAVLAALAVDAGRPVMLQTLIDRIWDQAAPVAARPALYAHISRLRKTLNQAETVPQAGPVRQAGGYALDIDPDSVDLHRFHRLTTAARHSELLVAEQVRLLNEALGLWRGLPLADLPGEWAARMREDWNQQRLDGTVAWARAELRLGHYDEVIGPVRELLSEHPLTEPLTAILMRALVAAGRDSEALDRYSLTRSRLGDELGSDPGPELRALHAAILRGEPLSSAKSTLIPEPAPMRPPVPRQLPAHTPRFAGRANELAELETLLEKSTQDGVATVVITAINGTAGVGKTALALHWAHHVAERFPDGQLYVNLRGFDPTGTPARPGESLRGFLHGLGVHPEQIPTTVDAQAALYRSLTAERRLLVVLDNARDAEHLRPLLPAGPGCLVVVTSRNQLAGLTAQEGARLITLDVLTAEDALALLTRHLGHDRVAADPDAVTELIEQCARLPLALAIVAARATTYPSFALRVLVKELSDASTRLASLDTGDATTSIRTVFSWSYDHLSAEARRMFRLFGLHPGPHIALFAAARLADLDPARTRETLDELVQAQLLMQFTPGRYTCHDLLRAYAVNLSAAHDPEDDRSSAITRLFDHYLQTTASAMRFIHHPKDQYWSDVPPPAESASPIADLATADAWFTAERVNLSAIIAHAVTRGSYPDTARLAVILLFRCVELGDNYADSLTIYSHALRAAQDAGDHATEVYALTYIGIAHWQRGHYEQAINHHEHAITVSREIGNPVTEALALSYLGLVHWRQGNYRLATEDHQHALLLARGNDSAAAEAITLNFLGLVHSQQGQYSVAIERYQSAAAIGRRIGDRVVEAFAMNNCGVVHRRQGRYELATEQHRRSIAISRDIGDRMGEAFALNNLGVVHIQQGHYGPAVEHLQQALAAFRETGFVLGETLATNNIGIVLCRQGHYAQAAEHHRQALAAARDIGDRAAEPQMLNNLGESCLASGFLDQARINYMAALALATELGDPYEQAHACHGAAKYDLAVGDRLQAQRHVRQALALFVDLDVPDANAARDTLATLDRSRAAQNGH